jgi:hypothetical protein
VGIYFFQVIHPNVLYINIVGIIPGKKRKTRQHSAKEKTCMAGTSTETQMYNPIQHNLIYDNRTAYSFNTVHVQL